VNLPVRSICLEILWKCIQIVTDNTIAPHTTHNFVFLFYRLSCEILDVNILVKMLGYIKAGHANLRIWDLRNLFADRPPLGNIITS
jgi:hypothetical protein